MKEYYTVYKTINLINGKVYIGVHKTKHVDDDYIGSGKVLKRAIDKYGINNFKKEILAIFDNSEDMFDMESILVNNDFVKDANTYNIKEGGGEGGWDYINTTGKNVYGNNGENGKPYLMDAETRKNVMKCKGTYDAYLEKLSLAWRDKYENGFEGTFKGKKHSKEAKDKISKSAKERLKDPTKNSQYGSMWIYNEKTMISKKINKNDHIPSGWKKGRKIKKT